MTGTVERAWDDIREGLARYRVWIALASEDIGDQHRQTALGPLWLLVNYLLYFGVFLVIRDRGGTEHYPAYLATGLLVWLYISEVITQAISLFKREESFIKGTTLPLTVYVMRLTMQSIIRSGYALAGCIAILIVAGPPVSAAWAWSLAGIAVILATTPAAIFLSAALGAYMPDMRFVVANLMRIGIFLTPIFWTHAEGMRGLLYRYNPFPYYLEIVRAPVVEGHVPWAALGACGVVCIILSAGALVLLGRLRRQIVFVL